MDKKDEEIAALKAQLAQLTGEALKPMKKSTVARACGCKAFYVNRAKVGGEICALHKHQQPKPVRKPPADDDIEYGHD